MIADCVFARCYITQTAVQMVALPVLWATFCVRPVPRGGHRWPRDEVGHPHGKCPQSAYKSFWKSFLVSISSMSAALTYAEAASQLAYALWWAAEYGFPYSLVLRCSSRFKTSSHCKNLDSLRRCAGFAASSSLSASAAAAATNAWRPAPTSEQSLPAAGSRKRRALLDRHYASLTCDCDRDCLRNRRARLMCNGIQLQGVRSGTGR